MTIYNLIILNDGIVEIDELYTSKRKAKKRIKEIETIISEPLPKENIEIEIIEVN